MRARAEASISEGQVDLILRWSVPFVHGRIHGSIHLEGHREGPDLENISDIFEAMHNRN